MAGWIRLYRCTLRSREGERPIGTTGHAAVWRSTPHSEESTMNDPVAYRSKVRIERVKGPLRRAYLPVEQPPVLFGVHSEIAQHYGVDPRRPRPPRRHAGLHRGLGRRVTHRHLRGRAGGARDPSRRGPAVVGRDRGSGAGREGAGHPTDSRDVSPAAGSGAARDGRAGARVPRRCLVRWRGRCGAASTISTALEMADASAP